jgi:hypothetical protein
MSVKYEPTADFLTRSNYRVIHAGDDYTHTFTVTRSGAALDLTSAKLWFTLKQDVDDTDAEAKMQYSTDDVTEMQITDDTAGKFSLYLKDTDTASLAGTWDYDIKCKLGSGDIIRLARGIIEFLPNITQASA